MIDGAYWLRPPSARTRIVLAYQGCIAPEVLMAAGRLAETHGDVSVLAVTSADVMIRKLGGARWRALHRLAYPAGVLAVIHYFLMIKAGYQQPTVYAVILAVLLAIRVVKRA